MKTIETEAANILLKIGYINSYIEKIERLIKELHQHRITPGRKNISIDLKFVLDNIPGEKKWINLNEQHFCFLESFLRNIVDESKKEIKHLEGVYRRISEPLFKNVLKVIKEQEKV